MVLLAAGVVESDSFLGLLREEGGVWTALVGRKTRDSLSLASDFAKASSSKRILSISAALLTSSSYKDIN